jgi:hypothetical protein
MNDSGEIRMSFISGRKKRKTAPGSPTAWRGRRSRRHRSSRSLTNRSKTKINRSKTRRSSSNSGPSNSNNSSRALGLHSKSDVCRKVNRRPFGGSVAHGTGRTSTAPGINVAATTATVFLEAGSVPALGGITGSTSTGSLWSSLGVSADGVRRRVVQPC